MSSRLVRFVSLNAVWLAALGAAVFAEDWKPVDRAHLALQSSTVEKDADAEAIFWEVRVTDEDKGYEYHTVLNHYLRIKIFTDRGRETQGKVDLIYNNWTTISDIAGRTIKPDGTIVELKKDDVFDHTIIKAEGLKIKAKSFALPEVQPGALIEYRWRETRNDSIANYIRLQLQRDIPVQLVKYFIKPLARSRYGMRYMVFHGQTTPFTKGSDGYTSTTMANVPAFHEEPQMPPESEARAWMLVYYTAETKLTPEQYWTAYAKETHDELKSSMQVGDDVRKAAVSIVADASTAEEKLRRLYDFCRTAIENANNEASLTPEQRATLKENKTPADTLKHAIGNGFQIDMLFAALAAAAGFDARFARVPDRGDIFFSPKIVDRYFLRRDYAVAIRAGNEWRFFDPKSTYVPYGMLRWQAEGGTALICDPNEPQFVEIPMSPAQASMEKRSATLRLNKDGSIEGDIRIEYTGHLSAARKELGQGESPSEREKALVDSLKLRISGAELSDIKIENVTDPIKPLIFAYHVKAADYAQRTGKRLFLQPGFFQRGASALFPNSVRKHPVYFHYAWSEEDAVTIELPAGFELESVQEPAAVTADIIQYHVTMSVVNGRTLLYERRFSFGRPELLFYSARSYSGMKGAFDTVHQGDDQSIVVRPNGSESN